MYEHFFLVFSLIFSFTDYSVNRFRAAKHHYIPKFFLVNVVRFRVFFHSFLSTPIFQNRKRIVRRQQQKKNDNAKKFGKKKPKQTEAQYKLAGLLENEWEQ